VSSKPVWATLESVSKKKKKSNKNKEDNFEAVEEMYRVTVYFLVFVAC
jgi:hypothetical protein